MTEYSILFYRITQKLVAISTDMSQLTAVDSRGYILANGFEPVVNDHSTKLRSKRTHRSSNEKKGNSALNRNYIWQSKNRLKRSFMIKDSFSCATLILRYLVPFSGTANSMWLTTIHKAWALVMSKLTQMHVHTHTWNCRIKFQYFYLFMYILFYSRTDTKRG